MLVRGRVRSEALVRIGGVDSTELAAAAETLLRMALLGTDPKPGKRVLDPRVVIEAGFETELKLILGDGEAPLIGSVKVTDVAKIAADEPTLLARALEAAFQSEAYPLPPLQDPPSANYFYLRSPEDIQLDSVATDRARRIVQVVRNGSDVLLCGSSAAGKTVAVAQAATALKGEGWTATWLDLADAAFDPRTILASLSACPTGDRLSHVVILDNAQTQPGVIAAFRDTMTRIRKACTVKMSCVLIGWESARAVLTENFPAAVPVSAIGDDLIQPIAEAVCGSKASEELIRDLRRLASGDLLLLRLACDAVAKGGMLPKREELASLAYSHVTRSASISESGRELLYRLAALGQFEVDATASYARRYGGSALDELLDAQIVRRSGEFVSVGHRSLAHLLVSHLGRMVRMDLRIAPVAIASEYLQAADDAQLMRVLDRLDSASPARPGAEQHGSAFLVRAHRLVRDLVTLLDRLSNVDPSFGDNLASAVFAGSAMARVGNDGWRRTAQYIEGRWALSANGELPTVAGSPPTERRDFEMIQQRMREEDARRGREASGSLTADNLDLDRFHRTWALGLLLCFEGAKPVPDMLRLRMLKGIAEKDQAPSGAFYPERVPWCTARVVLGLAAGGESIRSHAALNRACEWLKTPFPDGPCRAGVWESGTGTWNSTMLATAMCTTALARAGVQIDDPAIASGVAFLLSKRGEWTAPGAEIDGAFAMEAHQVVKRNWRAIDRELAQLLAWSRERVRGWKGISDNGMLTTESSQIPFIAASMIGIVWDTVRAELPVLLEGLSVVESEMDIQRTASAAEGRLLYAIEDAISELRQHLSRGIAERREFTAQRDGIQYERVESELATLERRSNLLRDIEVKRRQLIDGHSPVKPEGDWAELLEALDSIGKECFGGHWIGVRARSEAVGQ